MENKVYTIVIELTDKYNDVESTNKLRERLLDEGFHNNNYPDTMYCIISDKDYSEIQEIAENACEGLGAYKVCVIEEVGKYFSYGA